MIQNFAISTLLLIFSLRILGKTLHGVQVLYRNLHRILHLPEVELLESEVVSPEEAELRR